MATQQAEAYPHPKVRPEWLGLVQEEAIEPERPIIDPHHHLWHDRPSGRYLIEDLASDMRAGHNIVGTVFLQCAWQHRTEGEEVFRPVGETEAVAAGSKLFETGAYGPGRGCAGIVGHADLRSPRIDAVLDAHVEAGRGHFRGIRHSGAHDDAIVPTISVVPPPGLLDDHDFRRGVARLGVRGLSYDAWQYHPQLGSLVAVARTAPQTPIVINHVGGPLGCGPYRARRDEVHREWLADMAVLASCANVHVKLGGLGMPINGFDYHRQERPPTSEQVAADWKPWIEPCIDLFGAERCMFESNFPVDKGMVGYVVLWNAFKRIASGASEAEKTALFHDTAARFYRLAV